MKNKHVLVFVVLIFVFHLTAVGEVEAGPCKRDQIRDSKGRCIAVPTTLMRTPVAKKPPEQPLVRVEVLPPPPVVEVVVAPPVVEVAPTPTVVTMGVGVSTPTLIRVPGILPLIVPICCGMVVVGGTLAHHFISQTTAVQAFGHTKEAP